MFYRPHQINWLRVDDDFPSHAVITGSDLFIENLNKSYNGTYRCVASNLVGEAYDDYILYVYGMYLNLICVCKQQYIREEFSQTVQFIVLDKMTLSMGSF